MNPSPNEQLCSQRASGPKSLAKITWTADLGQPTGPDLRLVLPHASQGHSAAVDPVPTAADFSPRVPAVPNSTRFSFPSASQGNVAVVGPVSAAATSHRFAGRLGDAAKATDAPNWSLR